MKKKFTSRIVIDMRDEINIIQHQIEEARLAVIRSAARDRGLAASEMIGFSIEFDEDREILGDGHPDLPFGYDGDNTMIYTVVGHVGDAP